MRTTASGCAVPSTTPAPNSSDGPSNAYPARISSIADDPGVLLLSLTSVNLARARASVPADGEHPAYSVAVIFKAVGDSRPYPDHGYTTRQWSNVPPRLVRLDELTTTKRELDLQMLLSEDSTFYGDLFAHVVEWEGTLYLEDGLHRALRAALHQRPTLHARVLAL